MLFVKQKIEFKGKDFLIKKKSIILIKNLLSVIKIFDYKEK
jgi:hypothetical protein